MQSALRALVRLVERYALEILFEERRGLIANIIRAYFFLLLKLWAKILRSLVGPERLPIKSSLWYYDYRNERYRGN